jgi:hypothetical protein
LNPNTIGIVDILLFFMKRIGIALFGSRRAFRGARHLAPITAIFHRPIHSSAVNSAVSVVCVVFKLPFKRQKGPKGHK